MNAVLRVSALGLGQLVAIGLLVFASAGTLNYWQGWTFLAVFALTAWLPSIYLQITNPVVLERRMRSGPIAEGRMVQKIVMIGLYGSLVAICVVSGLDHRFGWSSVPPALCLIGDVLAGAGLVVTVLVAIQNIYASTTVQVETGQKVVSTGLYGLVRHPMYTGNVLILVGLPLALGSFWALAFVMPGVAVLAARIHDEEKLLGDELEGYREYTQKVRSRLIPYMW
ncbi:isoprenylcysteine carboxylmethyltransferase family protein [Mycobacterium sp. CVI_P3]|uniref:Isoprenylcysteine carboxylmethyltransferase family protein n=1 Tax=Mycobacterium pinniadriaticum TaxID=2994102 RepID=A0ABT3SLD8_9MYCO|nr:isoprenylcysteine carboxylmethyltransferase family protein [Mycobacterium pinniadriaticum]MCX2933581.1 isoprenylcysteine carboxylmethyltransferase family protein [Mycobacterium pinniadriaticum]MCX2940003.1 isoprenylcysteine carboxylmethyltransferase family protein [Mycobacterium pinniadriaticum]